MEGAHGNVENGAAVEVERVEIHDGGEGVVSKILNQIITLELKLNSNLSNPISLNKIQF